MTNVRCVRCGSPFPGPDALARHMLDCEAEQEGIFWETPPKRGGGARKYIFTETMQRMLRMRPMDWARIFTIDGKTTGSSVASRLRKDMNPDDWEFKAGKFIGGSAVWARYKGNARDERGRVPDGRRR